MHFLNPQRGAHLGLTQQPMQQQPEQTDEAGIGSAQSGYAGPENGPFECENCIHFHAPNTCDHPQVQSDPEVNGQVDPEGCCNLFHPSGEESGDESEQQDESETDAIRGAGEQI